MLALLAGGLVTYSAMDKTVVLAVDGEQREVRTFAGTVAGVLERAGVEVTDRDVVAPSLDSAVTNGQLIAVSKARPLELTLDGQTREVWVTASSVDEAIDALGLRADGAYVSASRSNRIPLDGLALEIRTPQLVQVVAGDNTHDLETTAPTWQDALDQAGIPVGPRDELSLDLGERPVDGETLRIVRVRAVDETVKLPIPFATERVADSDLEKGKTRVVQEGREGVRARVWKLILKDGAETYRRLASEEVLRKPRKEIVAYGTKVPPQPVRSVSSGGGSGYGGLNWAGLANCESSGNPRAVSANGLYYGLYQFLPSTWRSVGGSGMPHDASASEQTYRAWLLYQREGRRPWPVCGKYL